MEGNGSGETQEEIGVGDGQNRHWKNMQSITEVLQDPTASVSGFSPDIVFAGGAKKIKSGPSIDEKVSGRRENEHIYTENDPIDLPPSALQEKKAKT